LEPFIDKVTSIGEQLIGDPGLDKKKMMLDRGQKFVNNRKGVELKHLYERELETIVDYCLVLLVLLGFHYVVSSSGAAAK
jgi:hypothetical protein